MSAPRLARVLAGGAVAAVVLGAGASLAPDAVSAPLPPASTTAAPSAPSASVLTSPSATMSASSASGAAASGNRTSGTVAPSALQAPSSRARTRLVLVVRPGRTVAVVGVLTRYSTGVRIAGRTIKVYSRTADVGRWQLVGTIRTSARGRVEYDVRDRPKLQFTLRFIGDRAYGPAASAAIVPKPTGARGLSPALVRALGKARTAAARAGLRLVVNSGFRSWTKQQQMYEAAVRRYGSDRGARRWVLPPQESTHVRGLAVDLGTPAAAAWLGVHGAPFGLCRAYADEAWHFEYRPDWVSAFRGRCPRPVATPGDPDPLSPAPRIPVR